MTDNEEQFDLTPQIDEPMNTFRVVHLHNKSAVYHLTRQVLLDSALTQNTYCFFYHILTKNSDEFNEIYGSFACLIGRSRIEADLYLNVHPDSLENIVQYVQTGKLNGEDIYSNNWETIDEIIDLATIFGMPTLVSTMRNLHPNEEKIKNVLNVIKYISHSILELYNKHIDQTYDIEKNMELINNFIEENTEQIINKHIKTTMYGNLFNNKCLALVFELLITPIMEKIFDQSQNSTKMEPTPPNSPVNNQRYYDVLNRTYDIKPDILEICQKMPQLIEEHKKTF